MPLAVVAVITAVPDASALIFPLASTATTTGLLLTHATALKSVFLGAMEAKWLLSLAHNLRMITVLRHHSQVH